MKAILFAALAGVCWGVGELFTKSVLHTGRVGPITAIAVRSTVALPVLWAAWFVAVRVLRAEPADWHRAGVATLLKLALGSGLVAGAAAMIFFYAALHLGEISRVKPIAFALAPAVAAVLAVIVLHEPLTARKAGGVAAILLGIVLLTGRS
ncbi:MAG: EamA family transporter [Phycisphaeraceae bacterium]|nr:EamA family transporter [Phycisphaeraceae bacterium]